MAENEKEMTTGFDNENDDAEENDSPIGIIIAGGSLILGGLLYVGRKIFKRNKYAEVDHGLLGRSEK